jgi:hypothetical protein
VQQKCDELSHLKIGIGMCYVTEEIAHSIIIIIIIIVTDVIVNNIIITNTIITTIQTPARCIWQKFLT